jgi:hypothetical protein
MMDELTRDSLYTYLLAVKSGAKDKNASVDLGKASQDEFCEYTMREGTARLADELIRRYGLDVGDN